MYLHLWDFDHLRDDPTVRFREEEVDGVGFVIISYMISNDELWKKHLGVECRGITFYADNGDLASLPFEKFFNVNEKEHTQAHIVAQHRIQSVLDKRDGSMITAALVHGQVRLKTKKTFTSDVAIAVQRDCPPALLDWIGDMLAAGYSPIFEYTAPDSKIVINYGDQPQFVLLAIRDMLTGEYLSYDSMKEKAFPVATVIDNCFDDRTVGDLLDLAQVLEDTEGWVVYTDHGRFKIKTKWYIDRHRMIDVRERDIAGFVLDETLDDLIPSLIAAQADLTIVEEIANKIARELAQLASDVDVQAQFARTYPLGKERADWVNANCGELSKFVHRAARGLENSDESYKSFYRQRYLSDFSLRSIGNPNFRGDDDE